MGSHPSSAPSYLDRHAIALVDLPQGDAQVALRLAGHGSETEVRAGLLALVRAEQATRPAPDVEVPPAVSDRGGAAGWAAIVQGVAESELSLDFASAAPELAAEAASVAEDAEQHLARVREELIASKVELAHWPFRAAEAELRLGSPAEHQRKARSCRAAQSLLTVVEATVILGAAVHGGGIIPGTPLAQLTFTDWIGIAGFAASAAGGLFVVNRLAVAAASHLRGGVPWLWAGAFGGAVAAGAMAAALGVVRWAHTAGPGGTFSPAQHAAGSDATFFLLSAASLAIGVGAGLHGQKAEHHEDDAAEAHRSATFYSAMLGNQQQKVAGLEAESLKLEALARLPRSLASSFERALAQVRDQLRRQGAEADSRVEQAVQAWRVLHALPPSEVESVATRAFTLGPPRGDRANGRPAFSRNPVPEGK